MKDTIVGFAPLKPRCDCGATLEPFPGLPLSGFVPSAPTWKLPRHFFQLFASCDAQELVNTFSRRWACSVDLHVRGNECTSSKTLIFLFVAALKPCSGSTLMDTCLVSVRASVLHHLSFKYLRLEGESHTISGHSLYLPTTSGTTTRPAALELHLK